MSDGTTRDADDGGHAKWPHVLPAVQVRVARPTGRLDGVVGFYQDGLGLRVIRSFEGHAGVMLGLPDRTYHLEFTQHVYGSPCPAPSNDNLLVFSIPDREAIDTLVARMKQAGYSPVSPENPYWAERGVTFEALDGWRIVLMNTAGI